MVAVFPTDYGYGGIPKSSKTWIGLVGPPSTCVEGGMGHHAGLKRPGATLLLLVALHSLVCAAGLSVAFVQFSSPVVRPTNTAIRIQAASEAARSVGVLYKSEPSRAVEFVPKVAGLPGAVEWCCPVVSIDFEPRGLAGRSRLFTTALSWFPSAETRYPAVVRRPS